jgi:hypothetical protein
VTPSADRVVVRAQLAAHGLHPTDDEVTGLVAAARAMRPALDRLHAVPLGRDDAPAGAGGSA